MTASKGQKRTFKHKDRLRFQALLEDGAIIPNQFTEEGLCLEIQKQLDLPIAPNVKAVRAICEFKGLWDPMPEPESNKRSGGYDTAKKIAERALRELNILREDYYKEVKNLGKAENAIAELTEKVEEMEEEIKGLRKEAELNLPIRKRFVRVENIVFSKFDPQEQVKMPIIEDGRESG